MTQTNIRIATVEDAPVLHQLMHDAFTPLRELGIDWPSVNADIQAVEDNIINNTTFVLEVDNDIVSTITVRYPWGSVRTISGYPFVWWFATNPQYDGQGYGSQLLKYVEEAFLRDTLKAAAVTLGTSARLHPWLLSIYEKRGYEIYAEHENDDGDLGVIMRKILIPERFEAEILGQPPF
ncbi:GNAT family N-acetyltransferase [Staphylococcus simiae]|uniref:GNAT family N-acetyltransferase n=1 Tax=Staphylococcus simiae TaxID=308354 RepID=UPI001A9733C1|nr:GNAT family N-acetyltransferase [Staphylococcus simiae]MBO1199653.1 GNAT family N-acetyltransferase [Staphylococcus simiae]MBO1202024.1 GNAT family N-acetyltransferase [Staphylococcus simiae]MBO1204239.1 GNAT family N-acetyltransferase [Staphylococcus simiae]MBO1211693.1 GNAT family N-acetyltransferase [Staphylococcus simiae]MBO1230445.1 GNAT family N-acetyltransferase [Staphylococcus simiae]